MRLLLGLEWLCQTETISYSYAEMGSVGVVSLACEAGYFQRGTVVINANVVCHAPASAVSG